MNLLRKKTNNDDIARRAKRLVKKWQKLVQNHLDAVRNTNSPINGIRLNSPIVVNGSVKNEEQANSPADTATIVDHKGTKRKRLSVDSLSPGNTKGNAEFGNNDNTLSNENKDDNNTHQHSGLISSQSSFDSEDTFSQENSSTEGSKNIATNLLKRIKTHDEDCRQNSTQVDSNTLDTGEKITNVTEVTPLVQTNNSDHTDVRWEGKDVGIQTDKMEDLSQSSTTQISPVLLLDVEQQANGVNGRFGEDGTWYPWSETMSCNEGNLIILPYVLLE